MKRPLRLRFSRLRLSALTLLDLGLAVLSALGIQDGRLWLMVPAYFLLAFSACLMLLLCREWFLPSYIELARDRLSLRWNNWRLEGQRLHAELSSSRPRTLILTIGDPVVGLDPVGPLHLAARYAARPLLSLLLPPPLAHLYFLDSAKLRNIIAPDGGPAVLRFPAWLLGKRRIKYVLEKSMV